MWLDMQLLTERGLSEGCLIQQNDKKDWKKQEKQLII